MTKYLDLTGLQKVLTKIVEFVNSAIAAIPLAGSGKNGLMTDADKTKLDGIENGANANVIEKISVNGSNQTVTEKGVNINVPTKLNELSNTETDYQSGTQVDAKIAAAISSTYKPAGSKSSSELTSALLTAENVGNVYNVTDKFETTADFIEGAGKKHGTGANVVVIEESKGTYKFDVLAGFIDTSDLETAALTEGEINSAWEAATQS